MRYIFDAIYPFGTRKGIYIISQPDNVRLYRICFTNISYEQSEYIAKEVKKWIKKTIKELAIELTVETTIICDSIKNRSAFINQLLRSCSSIGANAHEAKYAQSRADFIHKMEIALKECYETEYWYEILFKTNTIDEKTYNNLQNKCGTIRRMLIASITTAKNRGNEKSGTLKNPAFPSK